MDKEGGRGPNYIFAMRIVCTPSFWSCPTVWLSRSLRPRILGNYLPCSVPVLLLMVIIITNIITQRVATTPTSSTCLSVVPPQRAVGPYWRWALIVAFLYPRTSVPRFFCKRYCMYLEPCVNSLLLRCALGQSFQPDQAPPTPARDPQSLFLGTTYDPQI